MQCNINSYYPSYIVIYILRIYNISSTLSVCCLTAISQRAHSPVWVPVTAVLAADTGHW